MDRIDMREINMQRIFDQMDTHPIIPIGMILLLVVLFLFRFRGRREE